MMFNDAGLILLKHFEGFKPQAYFDKGGVPTIGYGFTQGVNMGDTMTEDEAQERLEYEIEYRSKALHEMIEVNLTDNQFSALLLLAYNIGLEHFRTSTLLVYINEGNFFKAGLEMLKWDHVKGVVVAGLLRRREAEKELFFS